MALGESDFTSVLRKKHVLCVIVLFFNETLIHVLLGFVLSLDAFGVCANGFVV